MALPPTQQTDKQLQGQNDEKPAKVSNTQNGGGSNRKDRRKEWWQKRKSAAPEGVKDGAETESQRTKLRNRESIPKPDSLKYEHDLTKGFHSKIMQSLYINTPSKKKKKGGRSQPEVTSKLSPKRKSSSSPQQDASNHSKKAKPAEEPEVFDSFKFSMNLINGEVDVAKETAGKESKNKYVLFIGNLPYNVTREQLEEHFRKTGGIKSVRIPRDKKTDQGKGFAYMEFDGRISHGIALRLHQTTLGGRKINVEFTSIGGGNSKARKEKLKQKNLKRKRMKMH